jgi:hypothetical protein
LQRRFDELSTKQRGRLVEKPMTLDEAKSEYARLDMEHAKALDRMAGQMFGPVDRKEVAFRNRENRRADRQASGNGGAAAWKSRVRPTVMAERRVQVENRVKPTGIVGGDQARPGAAATSPTRQRAESAEEFGRVGVITGRR